jgi:hypothetical protein
MSRNSPEVINEETDDEDIEPSELIDTQENKPKTVQPETPSTSEETKRSIPKKQVSKLTDDEKDYLINLYKNGGEDDLYKVYFYKNGTNKIVKKKQPPKYNTAKRLLESQKPMMSNEQILLEHVIDLETKFATLYQKHKKLKKNYKSLQEDIYYEDDDSNTKHVNADDSKQPVINAPEPVKNVKHEPEPEPVYENTDRTPRNSYIDRIKRPQKGYRRLMTQMF